MYVCYPVLANGMPEELAKHTKDCNAHKLATLYVCAAIDTHTL